MTLDSGFSGPFGNQDLKLWLSYRYCSVELLTINAESLSLSFVKPKYQCFFAWAEVDMVTKDIGDGNGNYDIPRQRLDIMIVKGAVHYEAAKNRMCETILF